MIISVDELRLFLNTNEADRVLDFRIQALESFIKSYTNNDFVNRESGMVEFPPDVKMGAVNLLKWDVTNREKVGISSESVSRHSVSYGGNGASDTLGGYPVALIAFLKPYMRARF